MVAGVGKSTQTSQYASIKLHACNLSHRDQAEHSLTLRGQQSAIQHAGSQHPGFDVYRRLRDELLGLPAPDWIGRANLLAAQRDLRSAAKVPIRFVMVQESAGALDYEAAILHEGRIACRPRGRGALHDLHNALVWLTFPQIKAVLNRLHLERRDARASGRGPASRCGHPPRRERHAVAQQARRFSDAQLLARDWRGLMITNRNLVQEQVLPIIVGHGLLEKLASPYKAMTAHCLVVSDLRAFDTRTAIGEIDAHVARRISTLFAAGAPPVLAPLPVLGLPGWDRANDDPSYYEDARVFRVPHVPHA
jgi:hypothetical protein